LAKGGHLCETIIAMTRPSNHLQRILGVCLLLITLIPYWQLQNHGFVSYDDPYYVTQNPQVQAGITSDGFLWAFRGFHAANWHPVTWLSHMMDCQIYGLNPAGHHISSLLLHLANVLLLFLFLRTHTGSVWRSFLVAVLFAVHPLHVESVAWVAERKDVLSGLFWMLVVLCYGHYVRYQQASYYLLSLILFALGLMAKPMLVTLPFVLLLLDYWPFGRFSQENTQGATPCRTFSRLVLEKIPFVLLSIASCLVTIAAQASGGAIRNIDSLPFIVRILNGAVAYIQYLYLTVLPSGLAVFYPHPGDALGRLEGAAATLLLAVMSGIAVMRMKQEPYGLVGWFSFAGMLVPVIGIVQVGLQAMADRYTYLPHIGLFIALVWGSHRLWCHLQLNRQLGIVLWCLAISVMLPATYMQVGYWQSTSRLFRHALDVTESNYTAYYMLAREVGANGNLEAALKHYRQALSIYPAFVAMMHNRNGYDLFTRGELEQAEIQFAEALKIKPDYANAHNNLGVLLAQQEHYTDAMKHLAAALALSPEDRQTRTNLEALKRQMEALSASYGK